MATLIVTWPDDGRQTFSLVGERVTVGREPQNGIRIESPYLSTVQAEFRRLPGGGGYSLADLGSANGTFVNGIPARGEAGRLRADLETAGAELQALRNDAAKWRSQVEADREELPNGCAPRPPRPVPGVRSPLQAEDVPASLERTRQELAAARDLLRTKELRSQDLERGLARQRTEERILTDRLQMLCRQQFAAEKRIRELAGEKSEDEG